MLAAINFFGNVLKNESESVGTDIFASPSAQAITDITLGQFCICVGAALLIGFLISLVYIFCHRKEGYSQSYVFTIIMLPTIVSLILLLINTTAGALSLAGAFTLVRFRSVPGDPKDIADIFFSMAAGVACGIGYIGFAVVFFLVLGVVMFVLSEMNFGGCKTRHMTLKITIPENNFNHAVDNILYIENCSLSRLGK